MGCSAVSEEKNSLELVTFTEERAGEILQFLPPGHIKHMSGESFLISDRRNPFARVLIVIKYIIIF